jgi:hypothetical protein
MQPSPEQVRFWQWFRDNGQRLRTLMYGPDDDAREAASEELRRAVNDVEPGLILELGTTDEGTAQLIVSADGKPERADAVRDLVDSAPPLPGWEVIAFRPRIDCGDLAIAIQGERLSPEDVWFRIADGDNGLDLTLYVRGLTPANERMRCLGASLLAEHTMGEWNALAALGSLQTEPLPTDPVAAGLRPLPELGAVIDATLERKYPPPGALPLETVDSWQAMRGTIQGEPALMLLNTGLQPFAGHPNYDRRLVVSIPFHETDDLGMPASEDEFGAVSELGDRIGEALEVDQESLLALVVTGQGRRDLVLYTSNQEGALSRLAPWQTEEAEYKLATTVERDTFWGMYRAFCSAGSEEDEGNEGNQE